MDVYAVKDDAPVSENKYFFQQLREEIAKVGQSSELILLGVTRGRVGSKDSEKIICT